MHIRKRIRYPTQPFLQHNQKRRTTTRSQVMSLRKNRQTLVIDRFAAHVSQTTMNAPHSLSTTLGTRTKRCFATVSVCGLMIAALLGGFGFVNVSLAQEWQFVPVGPPILLTDAQMAVPNAESAVPNAPDVAFESVNLTLDAVSQ